jgi:hypothetical protein
MKRLIACLFAASGAVVLGSGAALAGANSEAFTKQLTGHALGKDKSFACFTRLYDAPHLTGHPQQNVTQMSMLVDVAPNASADPSYVVYLGVNFRGDRHRFVTDGGCSGFHDVEAGVPQGVHCAVSCDGGSIEVSLKDNGSVLVGIPAGARVWRPGAPDSDTGHGGFGSDDKVFRLDRASLRLCASLGEKEDRATLLRGP